MKASLRNSILRDIAYMNDITLGKLYYRSLQDCLGSKVEKMTDLGFCRADVQERVEFERYLNEYCSLIESVCLKRGIKLFDEMEKDVRNDN